MFYQKFIFDVKRSDESFELKKRIFINGKFVKNNKHIFYLA